MAGSQSLGTIRGTIEIDYDGAGIVRAVNDTGRLKSSGEGLSKSMSSIIGVFASFGKTAAIVGASSLVTNGALQAIAATLAVIAPLAAAGVAILPGIFLAAASAGAVLKIATAGVGDALKVATGDAKEFNKALEGLAPNARAFAVAYRGVLTSLKPVQQAIQNTFFQGLGTELTATGKRLNDLKTNAVSLAEAFNGVVTQVLQFGRSNSAINAVNSSLQFARDFLVNMDGAIQPLLTSFANLASQAGKYGEVIGGSVAEGMLRLTAFIEKVDLAKLFAKAQPIVEAIGTLLRDLASIAGSLFTVFNVDGANAAGIIGELASKLATFLESAEGQAALQAIGQAMAAIASGAGQVFLALLIALAPALVAIAPAVTSLAESLASLLVPAITALAGPLEAVAGFISSNTEILGPLAAAVLAGAVAYKIYAAGVAAWSATQAIASALHLGAVARWIATAAATVAATAATAANAVVTGGVAVAAWVANTAAMVANRIAAAAGLVVMLAVRGAVIAWTAVQWLLNVALLANPIGLIIIAIVAFVAAIIYAYNNSETFRNIIQAVWAAIKIAIEAVVNFVVGTVVPFLKQAWDAIVAAVKFMIDLVIAYFTFWSSVIMAIFNGIKTAVLFIWNALVTGITIYVNLIRTVVTAVFTAVSSFISTVFNTIRSVAASVWNAIVSVIQNAVNTVLSVIRRIGEIIGIVRGAFDSAKSAASNAISGLISLVAGLPGRAISALGNLGSLFYNKGRELIQGFINGIKDMIGAAGNAAKSVVNAVTRFLPGSPAQEGPLSGRGYVLLRARRFMADWARGMMQARQLPVRAIRGVVNPITSALPTRPAPAISRPPTTYQETTRQGSFGPYTMEIDGNVLTSFMIDAITGNPVPVAAAAQEGQRQTSWTNSGRTPSYA